VNLVDDRRFEERSGAGCGNSAYLFRRSTCCGGVGVEDIELDRLFIDGHDPKTAVSLLAASGEALRCPFCGAFDFQLEEITSVDDVPLAWRWACSMGPMK
jgi:hypothetical protein